MRRHDLTQKKKMTKAMMTKTVMRKHDLTKKEEDNDKDICKYKDNDKDKYI